MQMFFHKAIIEKVVVRLQVFVQTQIVDGHKGFAAPHMQRRQNRRRQGRRRCIGKLFLLLLQVQETLAKLDFAVVRAYL